MNKYPSQAEDAHSFPDQRLTQHFLTKILNKMHSYMEMSDYQVAAKLLHLPSQITSEVYGYSNPFGYIAYKKYIQSQETH